MSINVVKSPCLKGCGDLFLWILVAFERFVYFVYLWGIEEEMMKTVTQQTTRRDQKIATKSVSDLSNTAAALSKKKADTVKIKIQESGEFIGIPRKAVELLFYIVSSMAEGESFSLVPSGSDVSTQQAADMLNVSRPHVVKLLEKGVIPYKKVGSHRRIKLQDLMMYEAKLKTKREANFKFLAKQAQLLGLGYE